MRIFKEVRCPDCKQSFTVGFSEEEQDAREKCVVCRNQGCRVKILVPMAGLPMIMKVGKIDWHNHRSDN